MTDFYTDDLVQIIKTVFPEARLYKQTAATIFTYLYNHPDPISPINLMRSLEGKAPSRSAIYKTLEAFQRYGFVEKIVFKYPPGWRGWFVHQRRGWLMDNYGTRNLNLVRYNKYRWEPSKFVALLRKRRRGLDVLIDLLMAPVVDREVSILGVQKEMQKEEQI